jgi:hypothetical protein
VGTYLWPQGGSWAAVQQFQWTLVHGLCCVLPECRGTHDVSCIALARNSHLPVLWRVAGGVPAVLKLYGVPCRIDLPCLSAAAVVPPTSVVCRSQPRLQT